MSIRPERQGDPTRKEVPINPPIRKPIEMWYMMNYQCSVAAGFSGGLDEKVLKEQNDDKSPSEVERLRKQNEARKQ